MIISILVAMDENRGIGFEGKLPWHLSADLKRFRELTMGHHILAGRKTYESIGKPLPGRKMVIITRDTEFKADECDVSHTIEDALALARKRGETEAFVIGGAEIYAQTLGYADRLYLTQVQAKVKADAFFPEIDLTHWKEIESCTHPADEKNQYPFTLKLLERRADK